MSVTLTVFPKKIRFQKESFCIIFCDCNPESSIENSRTISIKGHVIGDPESLLGQELTVTGPLEKNQYGYTLSFTNYNIKESEDYFWQSVSGLSDKILSELIGKYGKNPDWLDSKTAMIRLKSINGIKQKRAEKIMERWEEYQGIRRLLEQLSAYDIPQKQIAAIHKYFGDRASQVLATNPYRLTEIRGIGFQKADEVARKLGVDETSDERFIAGIEFSLSEISRNGHTYSDIGTLYETMNEIMVMSDGALPYPDLNTFRARLNGVISDYDTNFLSIDEFENCYALKRLYFIEKYIADTFSKLKQDTSKFLTLDKATALTRLGEADDKNTFKMGSQQKKAVFSALTTPFAFGISGYAGTGKSTVSKIVLNILREAFNLHRRDIVCCALAGVAADRIKKQSGYDGYTIHTLLGFDGTGFMFNEENPLPYKIVLLDEAGMPDSWLFYSLLKAIDFSRTKLILMGDPAQVPPVAPGQPFIDLMDIGLLPYEELTEIFRQGPDKAIPLIAQSIRNGEVPKFERSYTDVRFTNIQSSKSSDRQAINQEISQHVLDEAYRFKWNGNLPQTDEEIWSYIANFQVITPRKTGVLSVENLNRELRSRLLPLPNSPVMFRSYTPMTVFDKVVHLNNLDMDIVGREGKTKVYNGQIGVITQVDREEDTVTVRYPLNGYSVIYEEKHIRNGDLGLAWALSIHKTQGSEYDNVIIPLTMSHFNMLNNRLTYTGATRPKQFLHFIGEYRALAYACTNTKTIERKTVLALSA